MSTQSIEPGQRLKMQAGDRSGFVIVLAEAVVPAGYWVCRDESSGQPRVIARTALIPLAIEPAVVDAAPAPSTATPTAA